MKKNKLVDYKWISILVILSFIISIIFTVMSELAIPNVGIILGIFLTLIFIFIGVLFDMIGVAITAASEAPINSMAAKKIKGAKTAIYLKKNAEKVSSFCNDVIGDICGIISGSTGSVIALKIANFFDINKFLVVLITMGLISALTIGGKAIEKGIAINKSDQILYKFAKFISVFRREK